MECEFLKFLALGNFDVHDRLITTLGDSEIYNFYDYFYDYNYYAVCHMNMKKLSKSIEFMMMVFI